MSSIRETVSEAAAKVSQKVQDAAEMMHDKVLGAAPKQRQAYALDASDKTKQAKPTSNKAVVWTGKCTVEVKDIGYPKHQMPDGTPIDHGVILKVVATNICGSDLHMYRGTAPGTNRGMVLGHEITGQVFDMGPAVTRFEVGDIVSVPFNVSCGTCDNCHEMKTSACLKSNPSMAGGAYGFAGAGGWDGGQAEYVLVPWADHQLLKLPKEVAMDKLTSGLTFLSDIFPTAFDGAVKAGVKAGDIVYVAGAGPVGLCAARSAFLLGASVVFVADKNAERLKLAASIGCNTIDLSKLSGGSSDPQSIYAEIERQLPSWKNGPHELVDCAIDCVGYEACGLGREKDKHIDEASINACIKVTKAGGGIGIPGLYPMGDLGAPNSDNAKGLLHLNFGEAWMKGQTLAGGQCPVISHNKNLMKTIIHDRVNLEQLLNVKLITLDEAPAAYKTFNEGEPCKYVIDPHGMIAEHRRNKAAGSERK